MKISRRNHTVGKQHQKVYCLTSSVLKWHSLHYIINSSILPNKMRRLEDLENRDPMHLNSISTSNCHHYHNPHMFHMNALSYEVCQDQVMNKSMMSSKNYKRALCTVLQSWLEESPKFLLDSKSSIQFESILTIQQPCSISFSNSNLFS